MKKILFNATLLATVLSLSFTGCKKGEEDPAISLKSRDSRIVNTWVLSSLDSKTTASESKVTTMNGVSETESEQYTSTTTYNGTTVTTNTTGTTTQGGVTEPIDEKDAYNYSETLTIDKGGVYTKETITTRFFEDGTVRKSNEKENGTWSWGNHNKNKTQLILDGETVYDITRLANDELVINMVADESNDDQNTTATGATISEKSSSVTETTMTYTAE